MSRIPFGLLLLISILVLEGCDGSDRAWDTSREALEGAAADQAESDEHWDAYRDEIVLGLDLMRDALSSARERASVVDRDQIDRLAERVESLRDDMASKVDAPTREAQLRFRTRFESVRTDVDALLTRLDYDPDQIARWQDET